MEQYCDLHTHSVYSDGSQTPGWLIRQAETLGLKAIALTDHNTVAGLPEFLAAAEGTGVEAVPGVEFSTDYQGMDIHVVALYVTPSRFAEVTALMETGRRAKEESNLDLIRNLANAGYPLDYAAIKAGTPNGEINRAHIARAMQKAGYVPTVQSAFQNFLDPSFGLYHPPVRPGSYEMIRFIKSIGAVSVLAHPFLKFDEGQLRTFLDGAAGLDGMETRYSTFDGPTTELAIRIAGEYSLLQSGGSDFHGASKPDICLGTGRGNLAVPLQFLNRLRERTTVRNI